ncbi:MAG: hypothetical protein IPL65_09900 [Lewinellaceae bacterium]|nr:hypothetical protein [Lewinellaceae bacterium]
MHSTLQKAGSALILLLLTSQLIAQTLSPIAAEVKTLQDAGVFFEPLQPLSPAYRPFLPQEESLREAQFLQLDTVVLEHIWQTRPQAIHVEIPYNGAIIGLDLYEAPILAPSFNAEQRRSRQRRFLYPGRVLSGYSGRPAQFSGYPQFF